jgi:tetratricopeptide (TPR) repeat protein
MRGDLHLRRKDPKAAIADYRRALEVVEALARSEPDELQWQLDILFGLGKLTDVLVATGDISTALAHAQRAEAVLAKIPTNPTFSKPGTLGPQQLENARGKVPQRLGTLLAKIGNHRAALEQLTRAKQVAETIAAKRPTWTNRRDIAVALEKIANVKLATGDATGGIAALEEALAIVDELHTRDRGNAVLANDVKELRGELDAARPPAGQAVRESAGHGQEPRVISR